MTKNQYRILEIVMVCILLALCFSIYRKHNLAEILTSTQVTQRKICYLTFDDGPSNHTEKILDILTEYDAKATFFLPIFDKYKNEINLLCVIINCVRRLLQ